MNPFTDIRKSSIGFIPKTKIQEDPNYRLLLQKLSELMCQNARKDKSTWSYDFVTLAFLRVELQKFSKRKQAYKFARKMFKKARNIFLGKSLAHLNAFTLLIISKDLVQILSDERNAHLAEGEGDTYLRRNF